MPERVEPTLTEAHSRFVEASTSGTVSRNTFSYGAADLCTSAEYPPRKSMPSLSAASSSALAIRGAFSGNAAEIRLTGVTETRLLTMGMPYSPDRSAAVFTIFSAREQTRS